MKIFANDQERRQWLAWRERVIAEVLKCLSHHVHVGSTQRMGDRVIYRGACTCGQRVEFTLSASRSEKLGGIDLLIEMQQHHEADLIFELVDRAVSSRGGRAQSRLPLRRVLSLGAGQRG